ncbi:tryptophan halogenase family protein [Cellvibrio sp. KY-YJ-3]|uniref:tryptophan halogenase family protein n=1 Tax=Cellvibrio sp. KY-YJ-3 TaxID=454662 RepID=UPI00124777D7|nr:tryptophan halogenase family protein [Cellvibrio sp. KY-YJ-3]QEY12048.1 tryptophan 7-halogenase [Cellvibrio sp. KY-YJ-3]
MHSFINNQDNHIKRVIIVGGGTAGWMSAATLSRYLKNNRYEIILIESDDIGTVGVGEATIPQIQLFNKSLNIDEDDFIRKTHATFKLGIEFVNWGQKGDSYIHAFGSVGHDMESLPFYHYWLKLQKQGRSKDIGDYCLNTLASKKNKFMRSIDAGNSPLSNIAYAFHFDAGLYAKYLREYSEKLGVKRVEGKIVEVNLESSTGYIRAVTLASGEQVAGDLFIDCSGFQGLLIAQSLGVGYQNWSHWLPCDSAWAVPSQKLDPLPSYTRATAHSAGWQWRIPLQHRTGNGHVFSSKFMDEEEAKKILLKNIQGEKLAEPRLIKFVTGRRDKFWHKNCIAIGLASGFMEPLESTSIHLVQSALARIMAMFPHKKFNQDEIDSYNEQVGFEYEKIRDFLILHYKVTERNDSAFWNYCREMDIPPSLQQKINVFKANGHVFRFNNELFNEISWVEVMLGQRMTTEGYHPLVDVLPEEEFDRRMAQVKRVIDTAIDYMPSHAEYIEKTCKSTV